MDQPTLSSREDALRTIVEQVETREAAARRRAVFWTLIPIVVAAALLGYSAWSVASAAEKVALANTELENIGDELALAKADLQQTSGLLDQSRTEQQRAQASLDELGSRLEVTQQNLDQAVKDLEATRLEAERYRNESQELTKQVESLQKRLDELNRAIDEAESAVREAKNLEPYQVEINLLDVYKEIAGRYGIPGEMLVFMLDENVDTPWRLNGKTPAEGFDSPGFAAYVLDDFKQLPGPFLDLRYQLRQVFPAASQPQVGDLVFYKNGYAMFYFNYFGTEFVVGMTPVGVQTLRYDFTERTGIAHIEYPR